MEHVFSRLGYPGEAGWTMTVATKAALKRRIPKNLVGVYLMITNGKIIYAGRSDGCLRNRLAHHEHLPAAHVVAWRACASVAAAYRLERLWYDRLSCAPGTLNRVQPALPAGARSLIYLGDRARRAAAPAPTQGNSVLWGAEPEARLSPAYGPVSLARRA